MGSSTSSVPKVQVDDAAIHGYVRAEVIEHRGDVILSEIANRAWSVSETRELNAHDSIVLKEERDRSRMHMVPLLSGSTHAAIITAVLPLKEKKNRPPVLPRTERRLCPRLLLLPAHAPRAAALHQLPRAGRRGSRTPRLDRRAQAASTPLLLASRRPVRGSPTRGSREGEELRERRPREGLGLSAQWKGLTTIVERSGRVRRGFRMGLRAGGSPAAAPSTPPRDPA